MFLEHLELEKFRNIRKASLELQNGVTWLRGGVGSGKTALLESIFVLSRGRSFKEADSKKLVCNGEREFYVGAKYDGEQRLRITVNRRKKGIERQLNGSPVQSSLSVARAIPVRLVYAGSTQLLEGAPEVRRRFVDWNLFHVEPLFSDVRSRFEKSKNQLNTALQSRNWPSDPWVEEFCKQSVRLDDLRNSVVKKISGAIERYKGNYKFLEDMTIRYQHGWNVEEEPTVQLLRNIKRFRDRGFVDMGPHRAEISISTNLGESKKYLSRGQMKVAVTVMQLGMEIVTSSVTGRNSIVLVDDFYAELDEETSTKLFEDMVTIERQAILTCTNRDEILDSKLSPTQVFHVEQGTYRKTS